MRPQCTRPCALERHLPKRGRIGSDLRRSMAGCGCRFDLSRRRCDSGFPGVLLGFGLCPGVPGSARRGGLLRVFTPHAIAVPSVVWRIVADPAKRDHLCVCTEMRQGAGPARPRRVGVYRAVAVLWNLRSLWLRGSRSHGLDTGAGGARLVHVAPSGPAGASLGRFGFGLGLALPGCGRC